MWDATILGVTIYYLVSLFVIFSVGGWLWESCYVSVCEKRLVNRGFVTGPFCTIYGCAAVVIYPLLLPISGNYIALFFGGMALATMLEYFTSIVMEKLFHMRWWTYEDKKFNFQGRICLSASLLWGAASILFYLVFIPGVNHFLSLYPESVGEKVYTVVFVVYLVDFILSVIAAVDLSKQLAKLEEMLFEMGNVLKSSRLYSTSEEIRQRLLAMKQQFHEMDYLKRYSRRLEIVQAVWLDRLSSLGIVESASNLAGKLREIYDRYDVIQKSAKLRLAESRIMQAYPGLRTVFRFEPGKDGSLREQKTQDSEDGACIQSEAKGSAD
ncbi:MAG: putative ABC transporter permease [Lachnospiraceae bacterium]|nr:putative ABC transporter permease [Lachnospiraceae bacterium]